MKTRNLILLFTVIAVSFSSCKKEAGPTGPAGTNGINGTNGTDGNADVKSITFNNPITNSYYFTDTLPGVNYNVLGNSLVLTYIQDPNCTPNWYSVPGLGCSAVYSARVFTTVPGGSDTLTTLLSLELRTPDGTSISTNHTISKLRVIVAPASTILTGKKETDYSDYKATCRYFNIAE